jgi:type IV pilus assembly protein PilM
LKLALPALFSRSSKPLLGVDISPSSVKVVELSVGAKTQMRLERYAIETLERGAIVDGNIENPEAVSSALQKALRRCGSKSKVASIALPSASVITKRISLPAGQSDDDYEIQVESEASQYIPFPIEEVNLDFQLLGPIGENGEDVEILLAAARKEKVEDRVAVTEMVGLRSTIVDIEPFAARSVIDHIAGFLPDNGRGQIVAVFDIGHASTALTVTLNGATIFEREQGFGGYQLTQDIVRLYGLTPEEAELKKRSGDLPDNYHVELVVPFIEQLCAEVARSLQFFYTSTPYTRVDRVFLAGGCSILNGLPEAVAERTNVVTEVLSPFQGMEIAPTIREKQLRNDAPALMVACGLAMRRFDA